MKPIRVNAYFLPVLIVAALLGSYGVARIARVWQTSGRDEVLLDASGRQDPEGIKGWMTLSNVSETYGVPLDALYTMIGAGPEIAAETELKEIEGLLPGVDASTIRSGVAAYLDGSWTPADAPYGDGKAAPAEAPEPTVVPTTGPTSTAAPAATAEHVPQGEGSGTGEGLTLPTDGSRLAAAAIKGRMTLQEVVDYCQVPLEYLIAELELPADVDTHILMREMLTQYGVDVTAVRDIVGTYQADH